MSLPTKKHLLTNPPHHFGKLPLKYSKLAVKYENSIVMEYADNGDVFQKICAYQKRGTYMKEKKIWYIFIQVVRGLKALHDCKILHRDMKVLNHSHQFIECEHFPVLRHDCQARGLKCIQSPQERPQLHPNWHSLLRFSRSLERPTL